MTRTFAAVTAALVLLLAVACASETTTTPGNGKGSYSGAVCPGAASPGAGERTCRSQGDCATSGGGDCVAKPTASPTSNECATDDECAVNTRCLTDKFGARDCIEVSCQKDEDCDCGACVGLLCKPTLGTCTN